MIKRFYLVFLVLIVITTLSISVSCTKDTPDTPDAPATGEPAAPAEQETAVPQEAQEEVLSGVIESLREEVPDITERADALIETINAQSRVPRPDSDDALVFLYMASAYTEPVTIAAGLQAMESTFTGREIMKERFAALDERYVQTVMYHLQSDNGLILSNAIGAAKTCLEADEPVGEVADRIAEIVSTHPQPPARYQAIGVLRNLSNLRDEPEKIQVMVDSLDSEHSYIVSYALFHLPRFARSAPDTDALQAKLTELLQHTDPGVRGRASDVLSQLVGRRADDRDEVAKLIIPLLDDENPFTKSIAFGALQNLDYQPAIHLIMNHLEDDTRNTYDIEFTNLLGRNDRAHHDGSAWSRVNDAALTALRSWSRRVGEAIDFRISSQTREEDTANAIQLARQWYESIKDDIPQP